MGESTEKKEFGFGYWIGKGIATIALWAGCAFLGALGLIYIIGPFFALVVGVVGTIAIWCPNLLKEDR